MDEVKPQNSETFNSFKDELLRACYRSILGREPEAAILRKLTAPRLSQDQQKAIEATINQVYRSLEASGRRRGVDSNLATPTYGRLVDKAYCFIHLEKTGGTTVDSAITTAYEKSKVLKVYNRRLYGSCPADLAGFEYFSGHIDFEDSTFLPVKDVVRFSIFRDPIERLISFYRFRRAHGNVPVPDVGETDLASKVSIEDYYAHPDVRASSRVDNGYMHTFGATIWGKPLPQAARPAAFKLAWERIAGLDGIGLTDRTEESVAHFFALMGLKPPKDVPALNRSDDFGKPNTGLKAVPKVEVSPKLKEVLSDLVKYDLQLYQLANARYGALYGGPDVFAEAAEAPVAKSEPAKSTRKKA